MEKIAWEPSVWDVLVVCDGEEFKGNRSILGRVPFFEAALAGRFREGEQARVEIRDACAAAFRAVWHYLYTDDCVRIAALAKLSDLMDVLSLGERFGLPPVLLTCGEQLAGLVPTLTSEELIAAIRAAKLHTLRSLYGACRDRIGQVGPNFLMEDAVCDLAAADRDLYKEIGSATMKRRRTI